MTELKDLFEKKRKEKLLPWEIQAEERGYNKEPVQHIDGVHDKDGNPVNKPTSSHHHHFKTQDGGPVNHVRHSSPMSHAKPGDGVDMPEGKEQGGETGTHLHKKSTVHHYDDDAPPPTKGQMHRRHAMHHTHTVKKESAAADDNDEAVPLKWVTLNSIGDTYLVDKEVASFHGHEELLKVGGEDGNKMIMKFDLEDLKDASTVHTATLSLQVVQKVGPWSTPAGTNLVMHQMNRPWTERQSHKCANGEKHCPFKLKRYRANSKFASFYEAEVLETTPVSDAATPVGFSVNIDVTDELNDMLNGEVENYGWMFELLSDTDELDLCSKEHHDRCGPKINVGYEFQ